MNLPTTLILGFTACALTGLLVSITIKKRMAAHKRRVREMKRTIQKLRAKNGHLWFEMITKQKGDSAELTQTNFTRW